MYKKITISLLATALFGQAATIPFSASTTSLFFDSAGSTREESISINGFNPSLGTLNSISLTLEIVNGDSTIDWLFQNQTTHRITGISVTAADSISLKKGATTIGTLGGTVTSFPDDAAAGAFLTQDNVFGADGSGTKNVSAANRALFINAGPVVLDVFGTGLTHTQTAGLTFISGSGTVPYTITVSGIYNYTPRPVPEPSALHLLLLGAAGIGLGIAPHRKR